MHCLSEGLTLGCRLAAFGIGLVYLVGLPVLIAYGLARHDPCRSCGGRLIHRGDCPGHFDA